MQRRNRLRNRLRHHLCTTNRINHGLSFPQIKYARRSLQDLAMKPVISVVGSANMDLVFRTPRMPLIGETIAGGDFHQIPGGKGANQAVAAARLGAAVKFIGRVGDDAFGARLRDCLMSDAIDVSDLAITPETATGVAGIIVDASGHNCIVLAPGANERLSIADIEHAAQSIRDSQLLICQLETPLVTVTAAIALAHEIKIAVILNPAPARELTDNLLQKVSYLIVNEVEAGQLSGVEVTDTASAQLAASKLLARGVGAVLLTMGKHGVFIADPGTAKFIPGIVVEVVDTTAAGDTFVGAFAVGIANGLSFETASIEAQYAAALTVTRLGAQTSIPHRQEVLDFMASRKTA
jgi:ribokinase